MLLRTARSRVGFGVNRAKETLAVDAAVGGFVAVVAEIAIAGPSPDVLQGNNIVGEATCGRYSSCLGVTERTRYRRRHVGAL